MIAWSHSGGFCSLLATLGLLGALACGGTAGGGSPESIPGRYQAEVFPQVSVAQNLPFGQASTADGALQTLLLDFYEPAGDSENARPAMVWVHGGGFVGGDKATDPMVELATRFARRGYVCVSINYRLRSAAQMDDDPLGAIRDAKEDGKAAVRWLRANAAARRIDATRIAIGGSSAGGYTALSVAYEDGEGGSGNPGFSSQVGAVVDLWGALVDPGAMQAGEAPLLIVHGTADPTVAFSHAQELVARSQAVGIPCEFHPLAGKGHAPWEEMEAIIAWTAPFLKASLKL